MHRPVHHRRCVRRCQRLHLCLHGLAYHNKNTSLSLSPSKYTYEIPRSERIVFTLRTNLSRSGKTARSRLSCTSIRTDGCLLLLRQGEEERETKGREKKRQREDRGLRFTLFRVLPGWKGEVRKEGKKMKKTTLARESARY